MTPAAPMPPSGEWARIQHELRRSVGDDTFDLWLAALAPKGLVDGVLFVGAPEQILTWVQDRFAGVLDTAAATVLGPGSVIRMVERSAALPEPTGEPARPAAGGHVPAPAEPESALHPKLTFGQFVIGDTNRFAHAAALAVAEMPGQAYNPLFLYGPPGVGKTHLLQSIGHYIRAYGGGLQVHYVTAETFTNDFVAALQSGGVERFKARFRHTDVLLVDDVQFLQAKAKTEEEFLHTFNALYDSGAQLVLTCDRLPSDLDALEERLLERFRSGLVADITPPDHKTRLGILRKRVQHDGVELGDDQVLDTVAGRISGDARTLEGAFIRVVAFHSLTGRPLTSELADEVLGSLYPEPSRRHGTISIDQVLSVCCDAFEIDRERLLSSSRVGPVAWARQVAMYLAREHTGQSLPTIGRDFGGRSHTTVLHACRRAGERIAANPDDRALVHDLERRLHDPS